MEARREAQAIENVLKAARAQRPAAGCRDFGVRFDPS
jgi:hypothetical protein